MYNSGWVEFIQGSGRMGDLFLKIMFRRHLMFNGKIQRR